jgi:hypothetical protein
MDKMEAATAKCAATDFYRGGLLGESSVIALRHGEEVDFRSAGLV